jgi:glycerophosphoryl diester phosphodiesterase
MDGGWRQPNDPRHRPVQASTEAAPAEHTTPTSHHSWTTFTQPRSGAGKRRPQRWSVLGDLGKGFDDDPVGSCREVGAVACNPDYRAVQDRPAIVGRLHAVGLSVSVWTADAPADGAALTRAGVDGILTNTRAELLRWQQR